MSLDSTHSNAHIIAAPTRSEGMISMACSHHVVCLRKNISNTADTKKGMRKTSSSIRFYSFLPNRFTSLSSPSDITSLERDDEMTLYSIGMVFDTNHRAG